MKHHAALILLAASCAACSSKAADPQPDPAQMQRLLARLEACGACPDGKADEAVEPGLPLNFDEKVRRADRILPALEKMPTETLDSSLAVALLDG